ncbi:BcpB protein [Echria macrotheca]|uniref:BcpB protein n=1 Tax=Echria macrotheca TaxID=438768 RepID=A0AAJ0BK65_9PEZI|nr:BcpB protein [Echria macrotheca]
MAPDHCQLSNTLPRPADDGLASHLTGASIPADLTLISTNDNNIPIKLSELPGLTILFCYPRTASPGETAPDEWTNTPGARGCTAEAGSYRDNFAVLRELGVDQLFGVSVQDTAYQREVKRRLGLPFDLLSDEKLEFVTAMGMPTFEWEGRTLMKRITLALRDGGRVERVWYPVFPPHENADEVVEWLKGNMKG